MKKCLLFISIVSFSLNSCNSVYYSAMEKIGFEKRDLLISAVKKARGEQKETGAELQDAMTLLSTLNSKHALTVLHVSQSSGEANALGQLRLRLDHGQIVSA
jgi:hypothetical protein